MAEQMSCNVRLENSSANFVNSRLPVFPPPDDFPVCIDQTGSVLARFKDNNWPMQEWLGKMCTFSFGLLDTRRTAAWLSEKESYFFRLIMILIMWVVPERIEPSTLESRYHNVRRVFKFCSDNHISVSEFYKYPHLVSEFITQVSAYAINYVAIFRAVYEYEGLLGFKILDPKQIFELITVAKTHTSAQTPYIPSRISNLHLTRSLELVRDYNGLASSFESLFEYVWQSYQENNPTWGRDSKLLSPFNRKMLSVKGRIYCGAFEEVSARYGVRDVLAKWMFRGSRKTQKITLLTFSSFFNAVSLIGATCIASLSAMRREEINNLRVDCFDSEKLDGESVFFLRGETTKTLKDDDARWITCEDTSDVVSAMASIARLRMKVAVALGVSHGEDEVDNPFLILRAYEPWCQGHSEAILTSTSLRKNIGATVIDAQCPSLFSPGELIISHEDFEEALKANPDLDVDRYAVGKPWVFGFHQFRRTLMVNACLSQQVSPQSLQYQLKHLYLMMSMYYGRNASSLAFSSKVRDEYVNVAYESMARKALELRSPKFVSLISPLHKERAISFFEDKSLKQIASQARKGSSVVKETVLGICLSGEPCEYGSVDYVLACNQCVSGLASKANLPLVTRVNDWLEIQLENVSEDGPRGDALRAQHDFTQRLINVILVEE
ncbi:hypothetical protein QC590_10295 [Pseudomonas putida]|uniref:hypothetical protein n=1 Tax=Pseudomonas putida TaxID=303 RepID=UPI00334B392F